MIYEVTTADQDDADLRGIYEDVAFELLLSDNIAEQLDQLAEHIIGIGEFPEKFRPYENSRDTAEGEG